VAAFSLIAVPAQAAPATVYIYKAYFDSPGSDTGSNTSLNAEYVVIRHGTVSPRYTYTVRIAPGIQFTLSETAVAIGLNDPAGFEATGPVVDED
jgi:hypothetical protein